MVRVQVIAYTPTDFLEEPDTTIGRCRELVEKNAVTWVNVVDPDERTLDELETLFGFHPLALEDAQNEDLHPKVEVYDDTVFIVVRTIVWTEDIETDQLSIFLGRKFVVTIHDKVFPQLEDIRIRLRKRTPRILKAGADFLAYTILDVLVDSYFPHLDRFQSLLDQLEEQIVARPSGTGIAHLHDHPAHRHRLERVRDERRVLRVQRGGRPLSCAVVDGSPDRNPRMVDASKRVAVTGSSDETYREPSRTAWNATGEKYLKLLRIFEPYGFDLLARVNPKIRESALDLATGPGEPAMSIARLVGPDGRVVGIDLSEQMVQLATQIAKERRIPGVTFLAMDAEKLDFPDESFDLVASRFGFQIFANPEIVARQAYRVVRPKGRIGVAVWSTADKATAIDAVVGPMLEFAEPDETGYWPTPFELGGPGELAKLLADAGFGETQEERRTHTMAFKDEDEYIEILVEGTPLGRAIQEEDPPVQKKILSKTRANLRKWKSRKGILIPCEGVIVTGTK